MKKNKKNKNLINRSLKKRMAKKQWRRNLSKRKKKLLKWENQTEIFKSNDPSSDKGYLTVRNGRDQEDVRAKRLCVSFWKKFKQFSDPHFVSQFPIDFNARFWEMDLAVNLIKKYNIESASEGPDICINANGKIWVEAIAVKAGSGKDRVPERTYNEAPIGSSDKKEKLDIPKCQPEHDGQTILRYTSAISEKFLNKFKTYLANGIIAAKEPYVIAINGGQLPNVRQDTEIPRIVRSLFPVGKEKLVVNTKSESSSIHFDFQPAVTKKSGAEIPTDIFLDGKHENISAVVFSYSDCCNRPAKGNDWIVIHNPLAKNPLELGFFPYKREYWVETVENCSILHWRTGT